jgi:probable lipoprotein (TIGR04455 family)
MIRPDYDVADRTQTLRLVVLTTPLPDGRELVGKVWSTIAQRYVNDHRDFIAKATEAAAVEPKNLCVDGIDGVLRLAPTVRRVGEGVEAEVKASLTRCRDRQLVWSAEAGGTWDSNDKGLTEVTQRYVEQFGEEVRPYVAPSFRLLKATLDTLPLPSIEHNDAAVEEKISLP